MHFLLLLFSCSVVSHFLRPDGLQHAKLLSPSLSPGFAQTHAYWVTDAIQPFICWLRWRCPEVDLQISIWVPVICILFCFALGVIPESTSKGVEKLKESCQYKCIHEQITAGDPGDLWEVIENLPWSHLSKWTRSWHMYLPTPACD